MNRTFLSILVGLATVGAWLGLPSSALADPVRFAVGPVQGASGGEVEIPITFKGAKGLDALQLGFTYDPAVLEVKNVVAGPQLSSATVEFAPGDPGRHGLVLTSMKTINGDGVLFNVRVRVLGQPGENCVLKLEDAKAWNDETSQELLVQTEAGEFAVTGAGLPSWIWLAASGGIVLLLLLWLGVRLRGRRPRAMPAGAMMAVGPAPQPFAPAWGQNAGAFAPGPAPAWGQYAGTALAPGGAPAVAHAPAQQFFQHRCIGCGGILTLPMALLGQTVGCGACRTKQVAGR
jgi:hypothetical protein